MAVLWKDRKRICGLPITFTKYRLEGERLYVTKGLLRTVEDETLLYRVLDISLERTLADKIFGVGTIVLHCADQTHPQLRLENVRHSENVRAMLSEKINPSCITEPDLLRHKCGLMILSGVSPILMVPLFGS